MAAKAAPSWAAVGDKGGVRLRAENGFDSVVRTNKLLAGADCGTALLKAAAGLVADQRVLRVEDQARVLACREVIEQQSAGTTLIDAGCHLCAEKRSFRVVHLEIPEVHLINAPA